MDSGMELAKLKQKLQKIKEKGVVKPHRSGNTGIGKTLEDLMGIKENNFSSPDLGEIELKSARKNAKSMLTLFTKSPSPKSANSVLLSRFGYTGKNNKKELHTTIKFGEFNKIKGKIGFKIDIDKTTGDINLVSANGEVVGSWDRYTIEKHFKKATKILYVLAEKRGSESNETFWFNEAVLLSDFSFENFINMIREGKILIDIRIGQYSNGNPHDHGTGFRVNPLNLTACFKRKEAFL